MPGDPTSTIAIQFFFEMPRSQEKIYLFQKLFTMQKTDSRVRVSIDMYPLKVKLRNIICIFPKWLTPNKRHCVVLDLVLDGKDIANRFGMPLFQVTGRSNC